jgi:hypothetical protein
MENTYSINGETVNEYMLFDRAAKHFANLAGVENFHPARLDEGEGYVEYFDHNTRLFLCVEKKESEMLLTCGIKSWADCQVSERSIPYTTL